MQPTSAISFFEVFAFCVLRFASLALGSCFCSCFCFVFAFAFALHQPTQTLSSRPKRHAFVFVTRSGETPVLAFVVALALALAFALHESTQTLSSRPKRHAFVFVTRSGETPVLALAVAVARPPPQAPPHPGTSPSNSPTAIHSDDLLRFDPYTLMKPRWRFLTHITSRAQEFVAP